MMQINPAGARSTYLIAREQVFILTSIFTAILLKSRRIAAGTGGLSASKTESAQVVGASGGYVRFCPGKSGVRYLVFRHGAGLEARGTGVPPVRWRSTDWDRMFAGGGLAKEKMIDGGPEGVPWTSSGAEGGSLVSN